MRFDLLNSLKMPTLSTYMPQEVYGIPPTLPVDKIIKYSIFSGLIFALIGLVAGVTVIVKKRINKKIKEQDIVELYGVPKSELDPIDEVEEEETNKE